MEPEAQEASLIKKRKRKNEVDSFDFCVFIERNGTVNQDYYFFGHLFSTKSKAFRLDAVQVFGRRV